MRTPPGRVLNYTTQHLPRRRDGGRLGRLGLEARANDSSDCTTFGRGPIN